MNLAVFAADFNGCPVRATEDGRFSVFDVLVAFGVSKDTKRAQEVLKRITDKHSEVSAFCGNFKFPGRGQRSTPVATEEGMYQILMLCPGKRGAEFRKWAAGIIANPDKAMSHAVRKYLNQGRSPEWVHSRLDGILTRRKFTDILKEHGVAGMGYAACTDAINVGLFGKPAKALKAERGVKNTRDGLDDVEVAALGLTEAIARKKIKSEGVKGNTACRMACEDSAAKVKKALS